MKEDNESDRIKEEIKKLQEWKDAIDDLIKEITEEYDITTVINTHDMNSEMQIGDNIAFIHNGEIWWKGNKEELIHSENAELHEFVFASKLFKRLKRN